MHLYFGNTQIGTYGVIIAIGVVCANLVGLLWLRKHYGDNLEEFIILESYTILGVFIGAKSLYLLICYRYIEWEKVLNAAYFNMLMKGGFVFYGGLIGGLIFLKLGGWIHKIPAEKYLRHYIALIPLVHAFGRIGCFEAGCCYGIPYTGIGAVIFPENSLAPSGISLFPIQLVEAMLLFILSLVLLFLEVSKKRKDIVEIYLIGYGTMRFFLEYLRYDEIRGKIGIFSTSQWISIFLIIGGIIGAKIKGKRRWIWTQKS